MPATEKTYCSAKRLLKLTIAYDGTAYAGWQVQRNEPTVQGALEAAIAQVTGQAVRVLASGRTDAGVHALGQVVGLRTESALPPEVLLRAINAVLPHDIAVLDAAEAPEGFHPIRDAVRKRYRYVIHDGPVRDVFQRRYVWHYGRGRLDAEAMQRAAAPLVGRHDFRSFESSGAERQSSVRTIFELRVQRGRAGGHVGCVQRTDDAGVNSGCRGAFHAPYEPMDGQGRAGEPDFLPHAEREEYEEYIVIEVEADGFLYNMVRTIVGTLVQVGCGRQPESWPGEVLRAGDRRVAGPTAPPQGLFLVKVEYGGREEKGEGREGRAGGAEGKETEPE
jgi:tRNA pseudouridine38-40 synthase